MAYLISPLTETHIIAAEEEKGTQFVESLRKFLLNDRFTVVDLRASNPAPLSIVSRTIVDEHYEYTRPFSEDIFFANRI